MILVNHIIYFIIKIIVKTVNLEKNYRIKAKNFYF